MSEPRRLVSVFSDPRGMAEGLRRVKELGLREVEVYSPAGLPELGPLLPRQGSPIRFLVLLAGIAGAILGFWVCIGSALLYGLIVGAKFPVSVLPYCVIGFELTVLIGGLTAFFAVLFAARLFPRRLPLAYDPRFGEDKFGLAVVCAPARFGEIAGLLRAAGAEEVHERP
jgi:hypothetical protein